MKLENLGVKVLVAFEEKDRLDKWADTCNGKMLLECILLVSHKIEKVYHFPNSKMKNEFLGGLSINFGTSVEVL